MVALGLPALRRTATPTTFPRWFGTSSAPHVERLTVNVLFARSVKVQLRQLVPLFSHNQKVSCSGSVVVVHANGIAVVKQIFQWANSGIESQGWEWRFLGTSNVDRRLFLAEVARRVRGIKFAPVSAPLGPS